MAYLIQAHLDSLFSLFKNLVNKSFQSFYY